MISALPILIMALAATAQSAEPLSLRLAHTQIESETTLPATGKTVVLVNVSGSTQGTRPNPKLILAAALASLNGSGFAAVTYAGDFGLDLETGKLPAQIVALPKLAIDIALVASPNGWRLSTELNLFHYEAVNHVQLTPRRLWSAEQTASGLASASVENTAITHVQELLRRLKRANTKQQWPLRPVPGARGKSRAALAKRSKATGGAALVYQSRWEDPDRLRGRFFLGVAAGTPAGANLTAGYWGSQKAPLLLAISGFGIDPLRGAEATAAWIVDNRGPWKHTLGLSLSLLDQADSLETQERDVFGRVTAITTQTTRALRPYLGPTYSVHWERFYLRIGLSKRLDVQQNVFRGLFQLGYLLPVGG